MSSAKNIVEINGRKYDAITGNVMSDEAGSISIGTIPTMEDILALDKLPIGTPSQHRPKVKAKLRRPGRATAVSDIKRKPQKSVTLMRPAVKKPVVKSAAKKAPKQPPRISKINKERLWRAEHISKSSKIKRFHNVHHAVRSITPRLENLEVKEKSPKATATTKAHTTHRAAAPAVSDWPVIDQFERAVQEASSHLETFVDKSQKYKNRHKKVYLVLSLMIVLLAAYGAYSFIPVAKVKMASNHAGFSASLPRYSPLGYTLADPVISDYGKVVLTYKSRTDNTSFNLVQAPSGWNSEALVNNFLTAAGKDYQTVRGGGQTLYTYDSTNATWVDGGKWYKVEGNARLSSDQLIKLASNL